MAKHSGINPFYVLLVIVGTAFCVTTFAYGVMAFRAAHGNEASHSVDEVHPLLKFVDRNGFSLMVVELGLLGLFTVAAIATDQFWSARRAATRPAAAGPAAPSATEAAADKEIRA